MAPRRVVSQADRELAAQLLSRKQPFNDPQWLYGAKNIWLRRHYPEVSYYDFHRDVFPEGSFERSADHPEDARPNGILLKLHDKNPETGKRGGRYERIFDDLAVLDEYAGQSNIIISPIGYSGIRATAKNAYTLYAITIDLDYVGVSELLEVLHQMDTQIVKDRPSMIPKPTYIVNSGNGLHLYYVLTEPIALYRSRRRQLRDLKYKLTEVIWNQYTSAAKPEQKDMHGIVQGYRAVGSLTKYMCGPLRAFHVGERVTLEYLNKWTKLHPKDEYAITDWNKFWGYPGVSSSKGLHKERKSFFFTKRDFYDNYFRRIPYEAVAGARYNAVLCLGVIARKCNVSREEYERDAYSLVPHLDKIRNEITDTPFTADDVATAIKIYGKKHAILWSRELIEKMGKIIFHPIKRNGRKQAEHLKVARSAQDVDYPNGEWRKGNGRPAGTSIQREKIMIWRALNPEGRKADCIRATGFDKKTVYRWWDSVQSDDTLSDDIYHAVIEDYQVRHISYEIDDQANMTFIFTATPEQCAKDTHLSSSIVDHYWNTDAQRIWEGEDFTRSHDPGYIDVRNHIVREYYDTI